MNANEITKQILLQLILNYKAFPKKKDFLDYFNEIRKQYYKEVLNDAEKDFHTQNDQLYKWIKGHSEISDTNLTPEMASYIFDDMTASQDTLDAIRRILDILAMLKCPMDDYESAYRSLTGSQANYQAQSDLYRAVVNRMIREAFHLEQSGDAPTAEQPATKDPLPSVSERHREDVLPMYLTETRYVEEKRVLHRETQIRQIREELTPKDRQSAAIKKNILITGFGGQGKTSIARVLYGKMTELTADGVYAAIGWFDYHVDLKTSILNTDTFTICSEEKDNEKRWTRIREKLLKRADGKKILLFLDNVDQNSKLGQFPPEDGELQAFADAPDICLVLTSRLSAPVSEDSLRVFEIGQLEPQECEDLFCYYRKERAHNDEERKLLRELIERAGYHTLTVKLLALGSRYQPLDEYSAKIRKLQFQFHITTGAEETTAAEELKKLFDMESRTEAQKKILWEFSVLPQTELSLSDTTELLGCSRSEIMHLEEEGWLNYNGRFSIHPVIRSVIHLDLVDGRAPEGTMRHLITLILQNRLISKNDSHTQISHKLSIAEHMLIYCRIPEESEAEFYFNLGMMEYESSRKRLTSLQYLSTALAACEGRPDQAELMAEVCYQKGYVESTIPGQDGSAEDLERALAFWETDSKFDCDADRARDHLGYVLTGSERNHARAEQLLLAALESRKARYQRAKDKKYASEYATTLDNLGNLYMKMAGKTELVFENLSLAFQIRSDLYREYGDNITEVAWTAFNLGQYLMQVPNQADKAEEALRLALNYRQVQNSIQPGVYTSNVVYSMVMLAKALMMQGKRKEAIVLAEEAQGLLQEIDAEHTGFFADTVANDLSELLGCQPSV